MCKSLTTKVHKSQHWMWVRCAVIWNTVAAIKCMWLILQNVFVFYYCPITYSIRVRYSGGERSLNGCTLVLADDCRPRRPVMYAGSHLPCRIADTLLVQFRVVICIHDHLLLYTVTAILKITRWWTQLAANANHSFCISKAPKLAVNDAMEKTVAIVESALGSSQTPEWAFWPPRPTTTAYRAHGLCMVAQLIERGQTDGTDV